MTRGRSDRAWIAFIAVGAAVLRVAPRWPIVFTPAYVNFQTNDSWYHVRLVDYLVHHFPHQLTIDPFMSSGGSPVPIAPLFDLSIAVVALILGLGSPSPSLVHLIAALAPVAYAVGTIAAGYAIGLRLFGPRAALLGIAILAIAPGPFLDRTLLGYVDHHAGEACFAALTLLGMMRALAVRGTPRDEIREALIAGVWLGCYLLIWRSGAFLVFILTAWLVVQAAVDVFADASPSRIRSVAPTLMMALGLVLLFQPPSMGRLDQQVAALITAMGVLAVIEGGRWLLVRWSRRLWPVLMVATVAIVVTVAVFFIYERALTRLAGRVWLEVVRLLPGSGVSTVQEVRPALFLPGTFSLRAAWIVFGPSFFIGLAGCVAFLPLALRRGTPDRTLFAVWSLVMAACTLGQNRFGYYFALNAALLTGWIAGGCLDWAGVSTRDTQLTGRARGLLADGAVVLVAALVFYPNVWSTWRAVREDYGVTGAWHDALDWMKRTLPPVFDGPELFDADPATLAHASFTPSYTVMNWWDYGYWITQVAERVPVSNPTQLGADTAGRFFTATDVEAAGTILDQMRARFIVADADLPLGVGDGRQTPFGKFRAVAYWAGSPASRFIGTYRERDAAGQFTPVTVFYPEYYRTMAARLVLYRGAAAVPANSSWVITSVPSAEDPGTPEIIESRQFPTYDEAERYAATPGPGQRRVVGRDPRHSCVPLQALSGYRLVYEAPEQTRGAVPVVRIFERQPAVSSSVGSLPATSP